jgi:acyl-CoA synthetase (AMP-forming)/AMP-acid ligase II
MHISEAWRDLALRHGDRPAIVDEHGTWSYRALHARITRFGNALRALGLSQGDRVALLVPDIREYLEADYAIMASGFVRVPLDPRLTRAELVALLRYAGATALVTHVSFAPTTDKLCEDVAGLRHVITISGGGGLDYEGLLQRASERPLSPRDGDELASLNFSGGTTGAPKAAMLRHRRWLRLPQCPPALADRAGNPDVPPVRRGDGGAASVRPRGVCNART